MPAAAWVVFTHFKTPPRPPLAAQMRSTTHANAAFRGIIQKARQRLTLRCALFNRHCMAVAILFKTWDFFWEAVLPKSLSSLLNAI